MICLLCQTKKYESDTLLQVLGLKKVLERPICDDCNNQFAAIFTSCKGCGRHQGNNQLCTDCVRWQIDGKRLLQHRALYQYNDAMKLFMQRYKFYGEYAIRHVFNRQLKDLVKSRDTDMVVPIPVSYHTLMTRGFNQTIGLFENVRLTDLLVTIKSSKQRQSKFSRYDRLNREQFFMIENKTAVIGKDITLVDDVYTTGMTLYHAADILYQAGAKNVKSCSLAR